MFDYGVCKVSDLKPIVEKNGKNRDVLSKVILPSGQEVKTTPRFEKSLQMRFRFSDNIFKYFPPDEVFTRISKVAPSDQVRWCIEKTGVIPKLLSVTNPTSPIIQYEELSSILTTYGVEKADYSNGVVRSRHVPKVVHTSEIGGDIHENRFIVDTPIDGFGRPHIYISLLRQICTNGAVAYAPSFRSEITVGKKNDSIERSLCRALENYNNEEGFSLVIDRFKSATQSWASVNEAMMLYRLTMKLYNEKQIKNVKVMKIGGSDEDVSFYDNIPPLKAFMNMTGDLNKTYGLANLDSLTPKRQKVLPTSAKVYDLINFSSELSSHHMEPKGARAMNAFIGTIISDEFDLENTAEKYSDWKDLFIESSEASEAMASMT